ncbi:MAG: 4Fe-4S cluster-binding domain-containing protein, partial [Clostridia bacterium]|nr:4Fe-4S cluster-binding domain-containing protein [Clostridia bacterium]
TGFTYEELCGDSRANIEVTREFLGLVDILIDGRYVEELKNIGLIFRGSSNQRIIDMNLTRNRCELTLWEGMSKDRI